MAKELSALQFSSATGQQKWPKVSREESWLDLKPFETGFIELWCDVDDYEGHAICLSISLSAFILCGDPTVDAFLKIKNFNLLSHVNDDLHEIMWIVSGWVMSLLYPPLAWGGS